MARFCVVVTLAVCCLITGFNGLETWINNDCYGQKGCPAERNGTCAYSKCVCISGYYYSSSRGLCIKECPNIETWYGVVEYRYTSIDVPSLSYDVKDDKESCWIFCILASECRAVVYNSYTGECTIPNVTAVGLSSDKWFLSESSTTYVKQCA